MEERTAQNAMHCDHKDCARTGHIIATGEGHAITGDGHLFCLECAERPTLETMLAGSHQ